MSSLSGKTHRDEPYPMTGTVALLWALVETVLAIILFGPALDGGVHLRITLAVIACYWPMTLIILARRYNHLTLGDRLYILGALPAMLIGCDIILPFIRMADPFY